MTGTHLLPQQSARPIMAMLEWLTGTLLGSFAIGLCVIAVASVGLLMMSGRLPVRRGMRVVLGCFLLLGAPIVAAGFLELTRGASTSSAPQTNPAPSATRAPLPPASYDPYAGASLRQD